MYVWPWIMIEKAFVIEQTLYYQNCNGTVWGNWPMRSLIWSCRPAGRWRPLPSLSSAVCCCSPVAKQQRPAAVQISSQESRRVTMMKRWRGACNMCKKHFYFDEASLWQILNLNQFEQIKLFFQLCGYFFHHGADSPQSLVLQEFENIS